MPSRSELKRSYVKHVIELISFIKFNPFTFDDICSMTSSQTLSRFVFSGHVTKVSDNPNTYRFNDSVIEFLERNTPSYNAYEKLMINVLNE
jgi:hypothetical protein